MMITRAILLFTILIGLASPNYAQRPDWSGIWGIWGGEIYSRHQYPWYKGTLVSVNWKQIQPQRNTFNFSALQSKITQAANNGLYVMFNVYISPDPPEWLNTELGVGFFRTSATYPWNPDPVYPYYLDPVFEAEFKKMIDALADHIETYPAQTRSKIIGVQATIAKSGDPQPYDGTPDKPEYAIAVGGTGWRDYSKRMMQYYYEKFESKDPEIVVLVKPRANTEEWAIETLPKAGRKTNIIAQGYHLGKEMDNYLSQEIFVKGEGQGFIRGEFDRAERDNTQWFNAGRLWNVYWSGLWCLTFNMDIWNIRTETMNNPSEYIYAFEFYSKWAGYKKPERSIGAWVAFRDDIDCADTNRFPESTFGTYTNPAQNPNLDRFNAIATAFAPYGAKQDDPFSAGLGGLDVVTRQKGYNDVQWNVWRGNYRMHLHQINANETSQGYWRVGPKDQPYGRFARGFNHAQGKDAIYLDIADKVFHPSGVSTSPSKALVNIIYYDDGTGQWEVRYDAQDDENKLALKVTNTNTGRWKTLSLTLEDAKFFNRGPLNSDISIINSDATDNIFHMVEIIKQEELSSAGSLTGNDKEVRCWPNPYNPNSGGLNISYPIEEEGNSILRIYDLKGLLIHEHMASDKSTQNYQTVAWDGRNRNGEVLPNGLYLGKIFNENNIYSFRVVILS